MKKSVAQKWIKALRSGEYRQGKGALKGADSSKHVKYCCLGVLCDLAIKDEQFKWKNFRDDEGELADLATCELPKEVAKWAGTKVSHDDFNKLGSMNDEGDQSFSEIADYIEENYKELGN